MRENPFIADSEEGQRLADALWNDVDWLQQMLLSEQSEITDLHETLKRVADDYREIERLLGEALYGYGPPIDGVPHPLWGDHVATSLAHVAADRIRELQGLIDGYAAAYTVRLDAAHDALLAAAGGRTVERGPLDE